MKKLVIGLAVALMSAMLLLPAPALAIGKCEVNGPNLLPGWNGRAQVGCDEANYKGIWIQNTVKAEGMTDDGYESLMYFVEPTADRVILIPNESGTIMLQSDYGLALTGTDGQYLVYNALSSSFNAKTMSGDATIANSGAITIAAEAVEESMILNGVDGQILVSTDAATGSTFWQTVSGDATLTNAGAITVGTNKINTTKLFMNSVVVTVAGGSIYNSNTVSNGSVMTGYTPLLNVNSTAFANQVDISETTAFVCTTATPAYYQQYRIFYVEP
jgi:hypothetical protein